MIIVHPARDKISDKELAVAERETRVWPLESLEACQLFCFSRKSIKYATHTLWQRRERLREPLYFSVKKSNNGRPVKTTTTALSYPTRSWRICPAAIPNAGPWSTSIPCPGSSTRRIQTSRKLWLLNPAWPGMKNFYIS